MTDISTPRLILSRARVGQRSAVRVTDSALGITYTVIPARIDGKPRLRYLAMEPTATVRETLARHAYGEPTPDDTAAYLSPPFLDHDHLAVVALSYLAANPDGRQAFTARPRARHGVISQRPDDARLLQTLHDAVATNQSMRQVLHDVYGCALPTADDWIAHARTLPGANLPPARRGRPPGRKNINRTTRGE